MRAAALLALLVMGCCEMYLLPSTSPSPAPSVPVLSTVPPSPVATVLATVKAGGGGAQPRPTGVTSASLRGIASWYHWHVGEGAAGPALRKWLGANWRGTVVRVCLGQVCTTTRLTDFCGCLRGEPDERMIDLDTRTFAGLAPLSRGLIDVKVSR